MGVRPKNPKQQRILPTWGESDRLPEACFACGVTTTHMIHITAYYTISQRGWKRVDMPYCETCSLEARLKYATINAHYFPQDAIIPFRGYHG